MAKTKKRGKAPNRQKIIERTRERLVRQASETALNMLNVLPMYILCTEFGWGEKRGKRFMKEFVRLHTAVAQHKVSIDTLNSEVKHKMKIDIDTNWNEIDLEE